MSNEISEKEWRKEVKDSITRPHPGSYVIVDGEIQDARFVKEREGPGRPLGADVDTRNKIILTLSNGPKKFGELKKITGINPGILKKHLTILQWETCVRRKVLRMKGHHVEYSLRGRPYSIEEETMKWENPNATVRPYERYYMHTPEEEELAKERAFELHRLLEISNRKEFFDLLRTIAPGPTKYEFTKDTEQALSQAFQYYREQAKKEQISSEFNELSAKISEFKARGEKPPLPMLKKLQRLRLQTAEIPWYSFLRDMREKRFCVECFPKGNFVVLIQEPESGMMHCPKCGYSHEAIPSAEAAKLEGEKLERMQASYGKAFTEAPLSRSERLGGQFTEHELQVLKELEEAMKKAEKERPTSHETVPETQRTEASFGKIAIKVIEVLCEVDPRGMRPYMDEKRYREYEYHRETDKIVDYLYFDRKKLSLEMIKKAVRTDGRPGIHTKVYEKLKEKLKGMLTDDGYLV